MPQHRSSGARRALDWLTKDRVAELTNPRIPVAGPNHGLVARGPEMILADGHPWRPIPCLVCGIGIGDRPCRVVIYTDPRSSAGYYRVATLGYVMCSVHDPASDEHLIAQIHRLELPGCSCHSKAAAGPAARSTRPHTEGNITP